MNLKGYIFSRPFFGERVPQHIQNIVLRDYCKRSNINFLMSATEYAIKNSSYILSELILNYQNFDGIIFYSLLQLPENKKIRHFLYNKTIKKNKQIHFAVENIVAKEKKDFEEIEKIFLIKTISYQKKNFLKLKIGNKKNFITPKHKKTKRNFLERMINQKVDCMKIAKKYNYDYWDGDRRFGYGGYKYINGYNKVLAEKLIREYSLNNNSKILDIGCGKGFLIYEIKKILKNVKIFGIDISKYAKKNTFTNLKKNIIIHDARTKLPFDDEYFDLVISINTLHNFKLPDAFKSLKEIERVGKSKFICVESYRNENEQFNLQCWALTAETLIDVVAWKWVMKESGYTGDYEFIFF